MRPESGRLTDVANDRIVSWVDGKWRERKETVGGRVATSEAGWLVKAMRLVNASIGSGADWAETNKVVATEAELIGSEHLVAWAGKLAGSYAAGRRAPSAAESWAA